MFLRGPTRKEPSSFHLAHAGLNLAHTRLDLVQARPKLGSTTFQLEHTRLDLVLARLDLVPTRFNLTQAGPELGLFPGNPGPGAVCQGGVQAGQRWNCHKVGRGTNGAVWPQAP